MGGHGSLLCSNNLPLNIILSLMNWAQTLTSYIFYIHVNIILPSTIRDMHFSTLPWVLYSPRITFSLI
jgi:hypothetical protein